MQQLQHHLNMAFFRGQVKTVEPILREGGREGGRERARERHGERRRETETEKRKQSRPQRRFFTKIRNVNPEQHQQQRHQHVTAKPSQADTYRPGRHASNPTVIPHHIKPHCHIKPRGRGLAPRLTPPHQTPRPGQQQHNSNPSSADADRRGDSIWQVSLGEGGGGG